MERYGYGEDLVTCNNVTKYCWLIMTQLIIITTVMGIFLLRTRNVDKPVDCNNGTKDINEKKKGGES